MLADPEFQTSCDDLSPSLEEFERDVMLQTTTMVSPTTDGLRRRGRNGIERGLEG